jgi:hypothetical protein
MKLNSVWMVIAGLAAGILTMSIVPAGHKNVSRIRPSATDFLQSAQLDPSAVATLRRACGNCHSNETEWPWYSRVALVSWLLEKHVSEGRKFLNFSVWPEYGTEVQGQLLALAATELKCSAMPPWSYSALHKDARLSSQERSDLIASLRRESARLLKREQSHR